LMTAPGVEAADPILPPGEAVEVAANDWRFAASSYLWGTGISGTTSVGKLPPVNIDFSFKDIVDNLDFAYFGTAEMAYRRWLVFTDFDYVKITVDGGTPLGILASRYKLSSETLSLLATAGYRVADEERWAIDALAGARLYSVSDRLAIAGGLLGTRSAERSETWVDPVVGLRARVDLTRSVEVLGWGFLGGFGVSSDVSWDVLGALAWSPRENISAVIGYRASGVDFSTEGFTYDTVRQGPVIGLAISF